MDTRNTATMYIIKLAAHEFGYVGTRHATNANLTNAKTWKRLSAAKKELARHTLDGRRLPEACIQIVTNTWGEFGGSWRTVVCKQVNTGPHDTDFPNPVQFAREYIR